MEQVLHEKKGKRLKSNLKSNQIESNLRSNSLMKPIHPPFMDGASTGSVVNCQSFPIHKSLGCLLFVLEIAEDCSFAFQRSSYAKLVKFGMADTVVLKRVRRNEQVKRNDFALMNEQK